MTALSHRPGLMLILGTKQDLEVLERLRPINAARFGGGQHCLEDTRVEPLGRIDEWLKSSRTLFWLHGLAGSGKSSIAGSVRDKFEEAKVLAGSFFCKRDSPEQRDIGRIIPNLSYGLSLKCKAYKDAVLKTLEEEPDVAGRPPGYQLRKLFV